MKQEDFESIVFGKTVEFRKKEKVYKDEEDSKSILIEFNKTPYDVLIEKIKGRISTVKNEEYKDKLYIRYKDTGDSWELGYITLSLNFWKFIEDLFYNYKPVIYLIEGDSLVEIEKLDLLKGEKFFRSELDAYIE